jgi:protein-L-isoaspartate(D-aspartate) O-methyltransferase
MSDFAKLRLNMVDNQVRPSDVTDHTLIAAMLDIPRERFVPSAERPLAYIDRDIRVGGGEAGDRFLLAPTGLARLIQALELDEDDVVLDLACNTGYSSAILSRVAGSVVAVDSDPELVRLAEANLSELEIDNVAVVEAELAGGYPAEGPYDGILVSAGVEFVPDTLTEQLSDRGRMIVVEYSAGPGRAMLYERSGESVAKRPLFDLDAPVLPEFRRKPEFVF